jgi:hypothetical protein
MAALFGLTLLGLLSPGALAHGASYLRFNAPFVGLNNTSSSVGFAAFGCGSSKAAWSLGPEFFLSNGRGLLAGNTSDTNCPVRSYGAIIASSYASGTVGFTANYTAVKTHVTNVSAKWGLTYDATLNSTSTSNSATFSVIVAISVRDLSGVKVVVTHLADYALTQTLSNGTRSYPALAQQFRVWGDFRLLSGHKYAIVTTVEAEIWCAAPSGSASASFQMGPSPERAHLERVVVRLP